MNEKINKLYQQKTRMRRMAACNGKVPYESFSDANEATRAIVSRSHKQVGPYRCAYCKKYHIGTPTIKNRRHK